MTTTKAAKKEQGRLGENVVHNPDLEKMLEERESRKSAAKEYRDVDKRLKEELKKIEIDGSIRVGHFIIEKKPTESREVSFETSAGFWLNIKIADE